MKLSKGVISLIVITSVIILDQVSKFWVKTNFYLGEDLEIFSWFHLYFIENNGMAFGMEIGSKLLLTLFRIVVVSLGIWYICKVKSQSYVKRGYIICLSLIIAGALGNIIDCVFYGEIFNNPPAPEVAQFLPAEGGYGTWLHGRVVDMLYFPLFSFVWPEWMPFVGGEEFLFFQPVFNIADAAITIGILVLILFYSKYLSKEHEEQEMKANAKEEAIKSE